MKEKYQLTEVGRKKVQAFIKELKTEQKAAIVAGDTPVELPDEDEIVQDIWLGETMSDWGPAGTYEYFEYWPYTEHQKRSLSLFYLKDFFSLERKPLEDEIERWLWTLPFANPSTLTLSSENIGAIWLDEADSEVEDTSYRVYGRNTGRMYKIFKAINSNKDFFII